MQRPPSAPSIAFAREPGFRWCVLVPIYNGSGLLRRTLQSVVASDLGPSRMRIEVIDDASTQDIRGVVEEFNGRVQYWRQPENVGPIANFNTCLERASGELVHILHGDDLVRPEFYRAFDRIFADERVNTAVCRAHYIDDDDRVMSTTRSERQGSGTWTDALAALTITNRVASASIVARRSVYAELGGFRLDMPHTADWDMWVRLAHHGSVWFEDQALVDYRVHGGQDTSTLMRSGENMRERRRCIETFARYVEPAEWPGRRRRALVYSSGYAGRTAWGFARSGILTASAHQLVEAGRCLLAAGRRPPRENAGGQPR